MGGLRAEGLDSGEIVAKMAEEARVAGVSSGLVGFIWGDDTDTFFVD